MINKMENEAVEMGKIPSEQGSEVGYKKPPKANQFGGERANPRHNGSWKKEDTARYKLERMMELSKDDLELVAGDPLRPHFEQKLATAILNGEWREIKEMMEQVYGKPKESVDMNHSGDVTFINTVPRAKSE